MTSQARHDYLMRHYDINLKEYESLLVSQLGGCACCGKRSKSGKALNVDHCHKAEKVLGVRASIRGLLCGRCNKVLHWVTDNPQLLSDLAAYLIDPPAQAVLSKDFSATLPSVKAEKHDPKGSRSGGSPRVGRLASSSAPLGSFRTCQGGGVGLGLSAVKLSSCLNV